VSTNFTTSAKDCYFNLYSRFFSMNNCIKEAQEEGLIYFGI